MPVEKVLMFCLLIAGKSVPKTEVRKIGGIAQIKIKSAEVAFIKEAPFMSTLVQNPNHIGCHTLGSSESFFKGTHEIEKDLIDKALKETNWHRKKAAALLKISYKSLLNKIKLYGLAG